MSLHRATRRPFAGAKSTANSVRMSRQASQEAGIARSGHNSRLMSDMEEIPEARDDMSPLETPEMGIEPTEQAAIDQLKQLVSQK